MEYKVVHYGTAEKFEEMVNEALKDGWEPHGSFAVRADGGHYFQPMIRVKFQPMIRVKTPKKTEENLDREIRFCLYCGIDFREVDWNSVADESYCPSCSELRV